MEMSDGQTLPSVSKLRYEVNIIFLDLRSEIRQLCGVIFLSHQAHLSPLCLFSYAYNPFQCRARYIDAMLLFQLLQTRIPASTHKLLCLLVNVTTGSIQDKSFLATGGLGLPVRHSGGACRSYREFGDNCWTIAKVNFPHTSTDKWPCLAKEVSDCDEKGCGDLRIPWGIRIWEWKCLIFWFFAKKKWVKMCETEEVYI